MDVIEAYRQRIFTATLHTFGEDGTPHYNLALTGRGKKNWKSADLILAALYRFLAWDSPHGNNAIGAHGKTYLFVGFDNIHGYRNWDIFEALAPDPTRLDALTWITSYASIYNSPGNPLFDGFAVRQRSEGPARARRCPRYTRP